MTKNQKKAIRWMEQNCADGIDIRYLGFVSIDDVRNHKYIADRVVFSFHI